MSTLIRMSKAWAVVVVVAYALVGYEGWRWPTVERDRVPATVRSSPGGYRSFHFWHTGFSGGK